MISRPGTTKERINSLQDIFPTTSFSTFFIPFALYQFLIGYISNQRQPMPSLQPDGSINSLQDIFPTLSPVIYTFAEILYQFLIGYISNRAYGGARRYRSHVSIPYRIYFQLPQLHWAHPHLIRINSLQDIFPTKRASRTQRSIDSINSLQDIFPTISGFCSTISFEIVSIPYRIYFQQHRRIYEGSESTSINSLQDIFPTFHHPHSQASPCINSLQDIFPTSIGGRLRFLR